MLHLGTRPLETERLLLRRFEESDAEAIYKNWANDPEVAKYMIWQAHSGVEESRTVLEEWLLGYGRDDFYNWAIVPKDSHEPIGGISVTSYRDDIRMVHIGYCIGRKWWRLGITSEALKELIRFFFEEVGANRIESRHDPRNENSGKVMMKCGLKCEGTARQANLNNLGIRDTAYYAILAEDYFASR